MTISIGDNIFLKSWTDVNGETYGIARTTWERMRHHPLKVVGISDIAVIVHEMAGKNKYTWYIPIGSILNTENRGDQ